MTPTAPAVRARAPGKLILSGEHAVVYGRPALAMAIDRFAECEAMKHEQPGVAIDLQDLALSHEYTFDELYEVRRRLKTHYTEFQAGHRAIQDVLGSPRDLLVYAAATLLETLGADPNLGVKLTVHSNVPQGRGLGSSAAVVQALLQAMHTHLDGHLDMTSRYELALQTERLQHGNPSGVDPYVALHGGTIRFRQGQAEAQVANLPPRVSLVDTGAPDSSTGECVMQVNQYRADIGLWAAFEEATTAVEQALQGEAQDLCEAVKENHALLVRIGVVPKQVQELVSNIESEGTAAKICGAGAVRGAPAGMVWVVDADVASDAAGRHDLELLELSPVREGAHTLP